MSRADVELVFRKVIEAGEPVREDQSDMETEAQRAEAAEIDELRRIALETTAEPVYSYTTT